MAAPPAVVDVLTTLLDAEQESPFRLAVDGSPYLGRAEPEVKAALAYIAAADDRRAGALWRLIERLGGDPRHRRLQSAEQFVGFLSIRFLMPKLVEAKLRLLQHYRDAIAALAADPSPADAVVRAHLSEHAAEMEVLRDAGDSLVRA